MGKHCGMCDTAPTHFQARHGTCLYGYARRQAVQARDGEPRWNN